MNELLDTIERELVAAIRRRNARRRRRRSLGIFGGAGVAVALTAGAVGAGLLGSPSQENLLRGELRDDLAVAPPRGGDPARSDLRLTDAAGERWSVVLYTARGGWLITSAVPEELPRRTPPTSGRSPFAYAVDLADGPAIGVGLLAERRGERVGRLLVGQVDADARAVELRLAGRGYAARLSPDAIAAPIDRPPAKSLTPQGRALLRGLGDEVRLRSFAAALPDDALPPDAVTLPVTIVTTLGDGSRHVEVQRNVCASPRCGLRAFELPHQSG